MHSKVKYQRGLVGSGLLFSLLTSLLAISTQAFAQNTSAVSACETGSVITAITPNAGVARIGSVYSSTLYDPSIEDGNGTHNPQKIQVRVTKKGSPKANCTVSWKPKGGADGIASGWVFPDNTVSDANGYVSAWWVAGRAQNQSVEVSIQQANGNLSKASIVGSAYGHKTRANSIHVSWRTPAWDKFKADVTPLTWAPTTYYEVIGFNGGYTGIQSHQTLFSLWDVNGVSPVVVDAGISKCGNFGGEGTGIKCEAPIKPKANVTYRFELETALADGGKQDYTVYFTDTSTQKRQKLATLRLPSVIPQSGAYGFVEDWYAAGHSCLDNDVRAAKYNNIWYFDKVKQIWAQYKRGIGDAVYTPDHNEICANYNFNFSNGDFFLSTGGTSVGYPLNLPGSDKTYQEIVSGPVITDGLYLLMNVGSGMALDIPGGRYDSWPVEIYPAHGAASQQWQITQIRPGVYKLINPRSGLALGTTSNGTTAGTTVRTIAISNSSTQEWKVIEGVRGGYALSNVASNLNLTVIGHATSATSFTEINSPDGTQSERWKFVPLQ